VGILKTRHQQWWLAEYVADSLETKGEEWRVIGDCGYTGGGGDNALFRERKDNIGEAEITVCLDTRWWSFRPGVRLRVSAIDAWVPLRSRWRLRRAVYRWMATRAFKALGVE